MSRFSHLMAIVPISVLLTASFFVLFALRKIEEKGLRIFGCVVTSLLWLATIVVFSGAVYKASQDDSAKYMMHNMTQNRMPMDRMSQMMPISNPSSMAVPERTSPDRNQKPAGCSSCSKCQGSNKGVVYKGK
ncbi:MAG TPA: hypothetical protein PL125_00945 [Candidatus Omnitrophota bacterium]|nr:hypothetical protein [Candidatus Omnitrophota bacterium]HPT38754.1 hypothetical protein [Candidatus Omnitrophota bacterium]